jgi:hypothetical protein
MFTRAKRVVSASLLILAVGAVGWAGLGGPRPPGRVAPTPVLTIRADAVAGGVILSADARVTVIHRDNAVLWFTVQAHRRTGPEEWEPAGNWVFDDPTAAEMVHARKGVEARPVLTARRLTLAPGPYSVFVSIREDAAELRPDGSLAETSHGLIGESVEVDVP